MGGLTTSYLLVKRHALGSWFGCQLLVSFLILWSVVFNFPHIKHLKVEGILCAKDPGNVPYGAHIYSSATRYQGGGR
jgi:hypothetical protein